MRLLILACSARKRQNVEPVPAIDRYDGPAWRVLRKFQHDQPLQAAALDIYALSAEFGLITASQRIPCYDQLMTPERAQELRPAITTGIAEIIRGDYAEMCVVASRTYLSALADCQALMRDRMPVTIASGIPGIMQSKLRAWLHQQEWQPTTSKPVSLRAEKPRGQATVGGVLIKMAREELFAMAREQLKAGDAGSQRYRDWYVIVDDQPVAPKWLISIATKLPTSAFDAGAARRALLALGINVERV